eukprot:c28235_g1_i1 orf=249-1703(-)
MQALCFPIDPLKPCRDLWVGETSGFAAILHFCSYFRGENMNGVAERSPSVLDGGVIEDSSTDFNFPGKFGKVKDEFSDIQSTTGEGLAVLQAEKTADNVVDPQSQERHLLEKEAAPRHRPLTWFRVVRGVVCLLILLSTAFVTLIFLAPPTFLLLRLFSVHYSRKVISFILGHWLAMWPFLFEKVNKTKAVFAGDNVPNGERVLVLCNHRTEVDWMYLWNVALRKNSLGYVKFVLKSSVRNVPVFGWAFHILEFLLIDRKWQVDEEIFQSQLSTFKDPQDPLWLILFPEGTDFTEQKCLQSQSFAEEHGLPKLKYLLLPRTKGFYACLMHLRESLDAVYDITVGYKYRNPLFMDNAFGIDPAEVHIHIRRIAVSDVPESEADASKWLMQEFCRKDELLANLHNNGTYPDLRIENELDSLQGIISLCLILGCDCTFVSLIYFFSSYVKVYIALSCVYLAAATFFNHKPKPLLYYFRARPYSKLAL